MTDSTIESESLALLNEIAAELVEVFESFEGKFISDKTEHFILHSTKPFVDCLAGYLHLRSAGLSNASKLLVRPALEMTYRIKAVQKSPDMLFRFAYAERDEDKKLANALPPPADAKFIGAAIDRNWAEFRSEYASRYTVPKNETGASTFEAAEAAGLRDHYNTFYRLYCRFTHAAFGVTQGQFDQFEKEDNRTVAFCALSVLEALTAFGGVSPNLQILSRRCDALPA